MRLFSCLLCVALFVTACGAPQAPAPATQPVASAPTGTLAPSVAPTDVLTEASTPTTSAQTPTDVPTALPSETTAPTNATMQGQPQAAPVASAGLPQQLVVADQSAALLPEYASDLDQADQWDRYSIDVELNPAGPSYRGSMRLQMNNRTGKTLNELYLHLYPNHPDFGGTIRVDDVRVNNQSVNTTGEQGNVLLRVPLRQPLVAGQQVTVTMQFSGRTQRNASRRAYGAFNQEVGVWSLATFYPVLARYMSNGWDRRAISSRGDLAVTDTALYDVRVSAPEGWLLATTGVRVDTQPTANGLRQERFVSGPQRDFLLTALNGLDQASSTVDGTRITSYYQKGNPEAGQKALQTAEQSVRIYNDRFGRYPLVELDVIQAALTNFLGVEYPGIVLIEQNLYKRGNGLETTVAHEVGHQWWYSLVGNDAQGDPWLDEGLTSFTQIVYREGIGDTAGAAAELEGFRQAVLRARQAGRDGVIDRPIAQFSGNYVTLVYAKTALFFQALRNRLGDDVFYSFLKSYYGTYRYGNATGRGMIGVAQQTCNCDLQAFYNEWITTSKPVQLP